MSVFGSFFSFFHAPGCPSFPDPRLYHEEEREGGREGERETERERERDHIPTSRADPHLLHLRRLYHVLLTRFLVDNDLLGKKKAYTKA